VHNPSVGRKKDWHFQAQIASIRGRDSETDGKPTKGAKTMAATTRATGFGTMACPVCKELEATVSVGLSDLAEFTCQECGDTFTRDDVAEHIETLRESAAKWAGVLKWLDTAPSRRAD
jgi:transposase-like protein